MSALAFDVHRAFKTLCEAGAAEPLVEAFVETIGGNIATKADIAEIKIDIAESEHRVQAKIAEVQAEIGGLEARLYRQLWIMAAGVVGLTAALVKLLG